MKHLIQKSLLKSNAFNGLCALSKTLPRDSLNSYSSTNYVARRDFSRTQCLMLIPAERTRGNYTEGPSFQEVFTNLYKNPKILLEGVKDLKNEFIKFKDEVVEMHRNVRYPLSKGEIDMLYTFEDDESIQKFVVTTDSSNSQGYSSASFVRTQYETALFSGYINTQVPDDGKTNYAGFASILTNRLLKSFKRKTTFDWSNYNHLVLKIRGDGRTYLIILGCPGRYDQEWFDQYHYPLYTRGGPYWQLVKIPFSNFYFTSRGRIQNNQSVMFATQCSRFGITIADGVDGPFKLEMEYVGLEFQQFHKAICPYENYYVGCNLND